MFVFQKSSIYLLRAALYEDIFVLHKTALFHCKLHMILDSKTREALVKGKAQNS